MAAVTAVHGRKAAAARGKKSATAAMAAHGQQHPQPLPGMNH